MSGAPDGRPVCELRRSLDGKVDDGRAPSGRRRCRVRPFRPAPFRGEAVARVTRFDPDGTEDSESGGARLARRDLALAMGVISIPADRLAAEATKGSLLTIQ